MRYPNQSGQPAHRKQKTDHDLLMWINHHARALACRRTSASRTVEFPNQDPHPTAYRRRIDRQADSGTKCTKFETSAQVKPGTVSQNSYSSSYFSTIE
ncbi:hypothetical protein [Burkholderia ambifaria]|uniref:hypothetical protein n=1 Tax=Burkholderia ambifaria TaxID=152480 RepID=UPI0012FD02F9|nr:hypothetical protein [Burkholderia ambifaria]